MVRKIKLLGYTVLGHLFVAIGGIGIVIPVLPTTPFIILAFACYMRGSMRFQKKILRNQTFGPLIRNWRRYGSIPVTAKVVAVGMIVVSMSLSMYVVPLITVRVILVCIGICVSAYILTRPTRQVERKTGSL